MFRGDEGKWRAISAAEGARRTGVLGFVPVPVPVAFVVAVQLLSLSSDSLERDCARMGESDSSTAAEDVDSGHCDGKCSLVRLTNSPSDVKSMVSYQQRQLSQCTHTHAQN